MNEDDVHYEVYKRYKVTNPWYRTSRAGALVSLWDDLEESVCDFRREIWASVCDFRREIWAYDIPGELLEERPINYRPAYHDAAHAALAFEESMGHNIVVDSLPPR